MPRSNTVTFHVEDMAKQRSFIARDIPREASWGEALDGILGRMSLPTNNPQSGTVWTGRVEREGRRLHAADIVGDVLKNDDRVVLQPEVNAG